MIAQGIWDEHYRDLASIPLPGPALIIDVRKGSEYEPPLVWNLATELDDFVWEMEQHKIYRWRRLKHCIALLKLSQLPERGQSSERGKFNSDESAEDFTISDPRGTGEKLRSQAELIHVLREKIELVRANRASAIFDREGRFPAEIRVDPERPVVTVCFMADASDRVSMTSAATYARWLKEARLMGNRQWTLDPQQPYVFEPLDDQENMRSKDIRTVMMCFNVDDRIMPLRQLFRVFRSAYEQPVLDKTILLYCYGDNSVQMTNQMQAHQVELILYVLLLSGWEMLNAHESSQQELFTRANGEVVDCWPLDLIGVSSLEYSARWATRWLDYGLAEFICQQLLSTEGKLPEQEVTGHSAWIRWHQENIAFLRELTQTFPVLHVLPEIDALLKSPERTRKLLDQPVQARELYEQLTKAVQVVPELLDLIQSEPLPDDKASLVQVKQRWQTRQKQTARLPVLLLLPEPGPASPSSLSIQGLLPRAQRCSMQLILWVRDELHPLAQQSPELERAQEHAQDLAKEIGSMSPRMRRRKQKTSEGPQQELLKLLEQDRKRVQDFVLAQVELTLLEQAGLYNPQGFSPTTKYTQRLKELTQQVQGAARSAQRTRERAYERLQLSLSEVQPGSERGAVRLDTHIRVDLLKWPEMELAFARLQEELKQPGSVLPLLGYSLLALLGGAGPQELQKDLDRQQPQAASSFGEGVPAPDDRRLPQIIPSFGEAAPTPGERQDKQEHLDRMQRLQEQGTVLMALALCEKQVPCPATLRADLAKKYLQEVSSLTLEPTTLTKMIEQLRSEHPPHGANGSRGEDAMGFLIKQEQTFEGLLAALVNNEYIHRPPYDENLAQNDLFTRMLDEHASPPAVFADLEQRNILLGNVAQEYRTKSSYLLLPGNNSKQFMQENDNAYKRSQLQPVPFPDIEKMVYLRVHHIAYPEDELMELPPPREPDR
jgi:hypothetical protein